MTICLNYKICYSYAVFMPEISPISSAEHITRGLTELEFLKAVVMYQAELGRIALRYAEGNQALADDMVQDALEKAWRFRNKFEYRGENSLKNWLFTVTHHECIAFLRHEGMPFRGRAAVFEESRHGKEDLTYASPGIFPKPTLADDITEVETIDDIIRSRDLLLAVLYRHLSRPVMQALQDCQEGFAHALLLSDFGYSDREIAEMLNVALGTVASRINRARAYLKQVLAEVAAEDYGIGLRKVA